MFVKVTTAFPGKPDNEVVSRQIEVGEVLSGDLAEVAKANRWGEEVPPNTKSEDRPAKLPDSPAVKRGTPVKKR